MNTNKINILLRKKKIKYEAEKKTKNKIGNNSEKKKKKENWIVYLVL